jgi:integrase
VELKLSHLQQREDHWAIVDLIGKAAHTHTIPMPDWLKELVDEWLNDACIASGRIFRRVNRAGRIWGEGMTEKVVWHVVKEFASKAGIDKLAPHDLRSYAESRTMPNINPVSVIVKVGTRDDSA